MATLVIPCNAILETNSSGVQIDVTQVHRLAIEKQVVARQLAVFSPVFNCIVVEAVQIDWASGIGLGNRVNIPFSQCLKYGFSNLQSIEIPIHLTIFCFDQDSSQSAIGISLALMFLIELQNHLDDFVEGGERESVIKYFKPSWSLSLLNSDCLQFCKRELISPPVGLI